MPITSKIRQTMNKQISKGMLKDIQNIARKTNKIENKLFFFLLSLFVSSSNIVLFLPCISIKHTVFSIAIVQHICL